MKDRIRRIIIGLVIVASPIVATMAATPATAPSFPGGDDALQGYITQNMIYPQHAKDNGIEGVVDLTFTVRSDGTIGSIKIVRMIDPDLEQEAIRIVKNMPKWNPGLQNGEPVESPAEVKITFSL